MMMVCGDAGAVHLLTGLNEYGGFSNSYRWLTTQNGK